MKKILSLVTFLIVSLSSFGYDFEVDYICYDITSVEEKTVAVTYYNCSWWDGGVHIPQTVSYNGNEYTVRSIGDKAFAYRPISSVIISEGVTEIGNSAFYKCPFLSSARLPKGVKSLGESAFVGCM